MKYTTLQHRSPSMRKQAGAALAVSLIMLLLLTLIGVTAMQSTTTQERMAGNARERNDAFQVAEAALRGGEDYIDTTSVPAFVATGSDSTDGLYYENTSADVAWYLSKTSATASSATAKIGDSTYNYIIEELTATVSDSLAADEVSPFQFYRITARGTGPAGTGTVLLQSTYKR